MNASSFLRLFRGSKSRHSTSQRHRAKPTLEALEDRQLLSGFGGLGFFLASNRGVFHDVAKPLTSNTQHSTTAAVTSVHSPIANAAPSKPTIVHATPAVAPASPAKPPAVVDGAPDAPTTKPVVHASVKPAVSSGTATKTLRVDFGGGTTDWTKAKGLAQFDPKLGTLTGVEITNAGTLTSHIRVESLDSATADVTGTVSGDLTLTGAALPSPLVTTTNVETETFHAGAYDGQSDFGGTSGQDFRDKSSDGSQALVLNTAADLAKFIGLGQISLTETAHATSSASGAGNLLTQINSTATANVTVLYHYIPAPPPVTVTSIPEPPPPSIAPSSSPVTPLNKRMFLASTFRHST